MISFENARLDLVLLFSMEDYDINSIKNLSPVSLKGTEYVTSLLLAYFLKPFKGGELYNLAINSTPGHNELYYSISAIFTNPSGFTEQALMLAKSYVSCREHSASVKGEFYVARLSGILLNDAETEAIGLFLSETKETYLKIFPSGQSAEIQADQGININKLDKGCLILNMEQEKGYILTIADTGNKKSGSACWKDCFIKVRPRSDDFYKTTAVMSLCKKFVTEKLPENFNISRADQVDMLNRSMMFLKSRDEFNMDEYSGEVLGSPEVIEAFRNYKESCQTDFQTEIPQTFQISENAVKSKARFLRSVIKLDKNFHVYIHGSRDRVEKGYDDTMQMQYYKLFFKEEL